MSKLLINTMITQKNIKKMVIRLKGIDGDDEEEERYKVTDFSRDGERIKI